jgi:hypothetical protein
MKVETKIARTVDKIREENLDRRMDVAREIGEVMGSISVLKVEVNARVKFDAELDAREMFDKLDMIYKKLDNINV